MKFKKGDEIVITAGKDKGKKGKIEKISQDNNTVLIPGLNIFKRHLKKRDDKTPAGIIDFSRPISVGNIAFICKKCGKATRIGYKITNGKKERICKKCKEIV